MKNKHFGIILPAAGSGTRFGGGDKLLTDLAGKTVLQRAVELFIHREDVTEIVIVTALNRFDAYEENLRHLFKKGHRPRLAFEPGGRERWESVLFGLRHLAGHKGVPTYVAVHDAARPLTPPSVIDAAFTGAIEHGGAVPCIAEPATLKRRGPDGLVTETVSRKGLFQAQTPQCFELGKLLAACEKLSFESRISDVTDDAQVYERLGYPVAVTEGSSINLKITTSDDVTLARALLSAASHHHSKP